jgi:hypothetical protein
MHYLAAAEKGIRDEIRVFDMGELEETIKMGIKAFVRT